MNKKSKILGRVLPFIIVGVMCAFVLTISYYYSSKECKHDFTFERLASTCTENGYERKICKLCDYIEYETVQEAEHKGIVEYNRKEPTCDEDGASDGVFCSICETWIKKIEIIPKLEHEFEETILKDSTCKEKGILINKCIKCEYTYEEELELKDHQSLSFITDGEMCNGNYIGRIICDTCEKIIDEFGHSYEHYYVPSTCTNEGIDIYSCKYCDYSYSNVIPSLGHIKGDEVYYESTCTKLGHVDVLCQTCNEIIITNELPINEHNYTSNIQDNNIIYTCVNCNYSYTQMLCDEYVKVSFVPNCDTNLEDIYVPYGNNVKPIELYKNNYIFIGWYLDDDFTIPYAGQSIYEDTILYCCFEEEFIEGEYKDNVIITNVPTNYSFKIRSVNSNINYIKNRVKITNNSGEIIDYNVESISLAKFNITPIDLKNGEIYYVNVESDILLLEYNCTSITLMVKSDDYTNIELNDCVITINKSNVISNTKFQDGNLILLNEDILDIGDIFIINDDSEMIYGMYEVVQINNNDLYGEYLCTSPNFEKVFKNLEISASSEIITDDILLNNAYSSKVLASFYDSGMLDYYEKAFRTYEKRYANNNYKYKKIDIEPIAEKVSNNSIKFGVKVTALFEDGQSGYIKIVVSLVDLIEINTQLYIKNISLNAALTLDNSFSVGIYVLKGYSYGSTEEYDDISKLKFIKILKEIKENGIESIKKPETTHNQEKELLPIPLNICGIPASVNIHVGIDWNVFGQFGIDATVTTKNTILISYDIFTGFKVNKSNEAKYSIGATLAGKIEINPYIGLGFDVGIDNVFTLGVSCDVGPYVEGGGFASISFVDDKNLTSSGWYVEAGVELNLDLNLNAFGYTYTTNLYEGKYPLLEYGSKNIILYMMNEKDNFEFDVNYDSKINLNKLITNKCVIQNLDTLLVETKNIDCIYTIKEIIEGNRKYITSDKDSITISPCYETKIIIKFLVIYQSEIFEQTITFNINHKHDYQLLESQESKCGLAGYDKYSCNCGYSYLTYYEALEHYYYNGRCAYCDYCPDEFTDGLRFSNIYGANNQIVGHKVFSYTGISDTVTIPSTYNGLKVMEIDFSEKNEFIKKLYLNENIEVISETNFKGLVNLQYYYYDSGYYLGTKNNPYYYLIKCKSGGDFTIHPNTVVIADFAFANNSYIDSVTITDNVKIIGRNAFENCKNLTKVILSDNIEILNNYLFHNCSSLKSFTFPQNVISVGEFCFNSCSSLYDLYMCDNVETIGLYAFSGCTNLTNIRLSSNLKYLESDELCSLKNIRYTIYESGKYLGNEENPYIILSNFETDLTTLKKTIHPDTRIIMSSITNPMYASEVVIPADVKYIDNSYSIVNGKIIFKGVPKISPSAFNSPHGLDIYFDGTIIDYILSENNFSTIFSQANSFYVRDENNNYVECKHLVIDDSITYIPDYKFANNKFLLSVKLSNNLEKIGEKAFYNCKNLSALEFNNNLKYIGKQAFSSCESLKNITMNGNDLYIDYEAFSYCSLSKVILGDGVAFIGDSVFAENINLSTIEINNSNIEISKYSFDDCISLSGYIYDNAVYLGNKNDKYIILLKAINQNITSCKVHESTKYVAYSAFKDCVNLESILLEDIRYVFDFAFYNCTSLKTAQIMGEEFYIGECAFEKCTNLEAICVFANEKAFIGKNSFCECSSLTEVILHNVVKIDDCAFDNCTSLEKFEMPDSVVEIGYGIFSFCKSLTDVTLSKNIKEITSSMFQGCSSLDNILLPDNIEYIGSHAFRDSGLGSIYLSKNIKFVSSFAFYCEYSYIRVYAEHIEEPKNWDQYWDSGVYRVYWNQQQ